MVIWHCRNTEKSRLLQLLCLACKIYDCHWRQLRYVVRPIEAPSTHTYSTSMPVIWKWITWSLWLMERQNAQRQTVTYKKRTSQNNDCASLMVNGMLVKNQTWRLACSFNSLSYSLLVDSACCFIASLSAWLWANSEHKHTRTPTAQCMWNICSMLNLRGSMNPHQEDSTSKVVQ